MSMLSTRDKQYVNAKPPETNNIVSLFTPLFWRQLAGAQCYKALHSHIDSNGVQITGQGNKEICQPEGSITQTYTMHLDYVIRITFASWPTWFVPLFGRLMGRLLGLYVSSDQPALLSVWMSRLRPNKCFNRDFKQTHKDCERQRMCRDIPL